jgi:hypothetical protein
MIIAISGSSGLIGSALLRRLEAQGDRVLRLVRSRPAAGANEIAWDPARGTIDATRLEGVDAVVNLAGETIAAWPWSTARKARIRESRLQATTLLARTLAGLTRRPRVLVSASAVGYYGDRGAMPLDETSPAGTGFLADTCVEWEAAAEPAVRAGIRVVYPRIGMVLSREGGALAPLLLPFRFGLGGPIGSGRQYMSWIALDDLTGAIAHAISTDALQGAVNAVAPRPVTNAEFTRALGRAVRRPVILPFPAFAARLVLGEMADELLLSSARALPARLLATGFAFRHPEIDSALGAALS